jgi:hypothetical protein
MKHFVLPLTSEFYGVSMVALNKMLASNQMAFSDEVDVVWTHAAL